MNNEKIQVEQIETLKQIYDEVGIDFDSCALSDKIRVGLASRGEYSMEAIAQSLGLDKEMFVEISEKSDKLVSERNVRNNKAIDRIFQLYDEVGAIPDEEESAKTLKEEGYGDINQKFILGYFYIIDAMREDFQKEVEDICKEYEK